MRRFGAGWVAIGFGLMAACGPDGTSSGADVPQDAQEVFVPDTIFADSAGPNDTESSPDTGAPPDTIPPDTAAPDTSAPDTSTPPPSGACGDVTYDGLCEGTTLVYCQSQESGVVRVECAPEFECGVRDGYAECRLPGSGGCGRVTYEGYCDGTVAVYCDWEQTEVVSYDCANDDMPCGYVDDETGYWCVGSPGGGVFSVRGSFWFEKPAIGRSGLGAVTEEPVRNALVQVRTAAADELVATGVTDEGGAFVVQLGDVGEVYALALAAAEDDRHSIFVRDCPLEDCGDAGYVHAVFSENFTPGFDTDVGGWVAAREGSAGAFNILDVFMRGQDFAWEVYGDKPPSLIGQWAQGSQTSCGEVSCFSARDNTIFVLGHAADTDEFDDPVLAHEFGHYLEASFSRSDSPGGYHDGSPTDPRLAWGEGYGTFAGCELMGSSLYIDTAAGGVSVTDISDTGYLANPNGGMNQLLSEYLVAEILWTLSRGGSLTGPLGAAVIFDVLGAYFPTTRLVDRGVDGVDLVDFLDGLMCRGGAREEDVRRVVVSQRKFPYDFGGPGSCR